MKTVFCALSLRLADATTTTPLCTCCCKSGRCWTDSSDNTAWPTWQVERVAQTEPWFLLQLLPPERRDILNGVHTVANVARRDSEILLDSFWQAREVRNFAELLEKSTEIYEMEKLRWDANLQQSGGGVVDSGSKKSPDESASQ